MTADHIGKFIPNMPIALNWMGRLAAPIFLFCCAWSIDYTKNIRIYILRLYLFSIGMSVINYLSVSIMGSQDILHPIKNNIFRTLLLFVIIIHIYNQTKGSSKKRILLYSLFLGWQIITSFVVINILFADIIDADFMLTIVITVLGLFVELEGGFLVILGIGIYLFKDNRNKLFGFYLSFCLIYFITSATNFFPMVMSFVNYWDSQLISGIFFNIIFSVLGLSPFMTETTLSYYFTVDYQWMMIFALPIILIYKNNNYLKSTTLKYFFYIYYPVHLIIIHIIGYIICLQIPA